MSFEMVCAIKLFPLKLIQTEKWLFHVLEFIQKSRVYYQLRMYNLVDMVQSMNGIVCGYNLFCLGEF